MSLEALLALIFGLLMVVLGLRQIWLVRQANRQLSQRHDFAAPDRPHYINMVNFQLHPTYRASEPLQAYPGMPDRVADLQAGPSIPPRHQS